MGSPEAWHRTMGARLLFFEGFPFLVLSFFKPLCSMHLVDELNRAGAMRCLEKGGQNA